MYLKELKNKGKRYKYSPNIKYPGYTESFTEEIIKLYEQTKRKYSETS